jgi:hypothetical protein
MKKKMTMNVRETYHVTVKAKAIKDTLSSYIYPYASFNISINFLNSSNKGGVFYSR